MHFKTNLGIGTVTGTVAAGCYGAEASDFGTEATGGVDGSAGFVADQFLTLWKIKKSGCHQAG